MFPRIESVARPIHAALVLAVACFFTPAATVTAQDSGVTKIIQFGSDAVSDWRPVNDGVMGGVSSSVMRVLDDGTAVFEGDLSLENNGGFASVRTPVAEGALEGFTRLALRVRGDGKRYQVRLRTSGSFDGVAYAASFDATDDWKTIELPLASFEPTFRGYSPRNAPPLDPARVLQIGIMLTGKQEGPFRLELDWIGADGAESSP